MKKFIIAACILAFFLVAGFYAVYYEGFYLDLNPDAEVSASFRTEGDRILHSEDGQWNDFEIRGVDLSASMPGEPATDFDADSSDYLRWLEEISELGANTVRVFTVMDSDFYDAFYRFNTESESPLYLLQGLQVSDRANYGSKDTYDSDFRELLIQNGQSAVDVIHGRKLIMTEGARSFSGTGIYRHDISQWVMGYLVGSEWDSGNIAYTDMSTLHPESYEGTYFVTEPDAGRFETMMAEVMDRITDYETTKYKEQRLISFVSDPGNDPFEYNTLYATRFFKYNQIDAENIRTTEALTSGYFAAYRLSQFNDEFMTYFTPEQKSRLGSILDNLNTEAVYNGYLDLLGRYHSDPGRRRRIRGFPQREPRCTRERNRLQKRNREKASSKCAKMPKMPDGPACLSLHGRMSGKDGPGIPVMRHSIRCFLSGRTYRLTGSLTVSCSFLCRKSRYVL